MFVEKTAEQVAALTTEEQIKYFNELNQHRAEKMAQLEKSLKESNTAEIKASIDALKNEINASNLEQFKALQKSLETQGVALTQLMSEGRKSEGQSLNSILEGFEDTLTKMVGSKNETVKFKIDKTTVLTSAVGSSTIGMREGSIGQIARARDVIRQLFATGGVSPGQGGVVRYIDQTTNTNGAAMQTEGSKKGEGAIAWTENSMTLQVVAEWIKVSRQALTDFSFIESEIRNKLLRDLAAKVEDEVWDGTGTAPELKGVYTYAGTYTATAAGITDASIYDLIVKVSEAIAGSTNYMPNIAIMNIADINKMKLKKDANNNYIMPPFATANGQQVDGITIVPSSQVTANTMLVGDFDYATLYSLGGIDVTIGYENDDFTKNLVTILAEERLGLLVRSVDTGAFKKVTDIAAALATLTTEEA